MLSPGALEGELHTRPGESLVPTARSFPSCSSQSEVRTGQINQSNLRTLNDVPLLGVVRLASRERVLLPRPALGSWDASAGERVVVLLRLLRGCDDFGPRRREKDHAHPAELTMGYGSDPIWKSGLCRRPAPRRPKMLLLVVLLARTEPLGTLGALRRTTGRKFGRLAAVHGVGPPRRKEVQRL
jgi:hypothetical protein